MFQRRTADAVTTPSPKNKRVSEEFSPQLEGTPLMHHGGVPIRQETHRIFIQTLNNGEFQTLAAAIRLTESATVLDITRLLRRKFQLGALIENNTANEMSYHGQDVLLMVATLKDVPVKSLSFYGAMEVSASDNYSEPFHIVRALLQHQCPLLCRDEMLVYLESHSIRNLNSNNSPYDICWFFQPSFPTSKNETSKISTLAYVELGTGYITSVECETSSDNDDDEDSLRFNKRLDLMNKHDNHLFGNSLENSVQNALLDLLEGSKSDSDQKPSDSYKASEAIIGANGNGRANSDAVIHQKARIDKQRQLHGKATLDRCLTPRKHSVQAQSSFVHGFLYKRSNANIFVWKRVYCILVEDMLWYISRRKLTQGNLQQTQNPQPWSRIRNLSLVHAQIISDPIESSPLSTVPHVFEIRSSSSNLIHYFRATRRDMKLRWISTIADRIVTYGESHMMNMAETMIHDEEIARAHRLETNVILPCLNKSSRYPNSWLTRSKVPLFSMSGEGCEFIDAVRFGMLVEEFREACRHHTEIFGFLEDKCESNVLANIVQEYDMPRGTPVKEIKRVAQKQLHQASSSINSLWDLAASVCAQAQVVTAMNGCSDEEQQLKQELNALQGNLFFVIQESQSSQLAAPPPMTFFDEMWHIRLSLAQLAERRHKENGLFGS